MQAVNEVSISLQLTLLITGIETFRRPILKCHSLLGAKPVCLTQRCLRISSGTFGIPFERRYCSVAQTTRRTLPTGIATSEESLRCAIRTATSTCSSPKLRTRSPNRRSMLLSDDDAESHSRPGPHSVGQTTRKRLPSDFLAAPLRAR